MNLNRNIPISFIKKYYQLTWDDCYLGLIESWLTLDDVIKHALSKIESGLYNDEEFALASLYSYENEQALSILRTLSTLDASESKSAWLKIILLWIFENNSDVYSLQNDVESLYEGFSYPDEISQLIKYNVDFSDIDNNFSWEYVFLKRYGNLLYKWFGYENKFIKES